jgi:uncharacterized protein (TIGR03118 family)
MMKNEQLMRSGLRPGVACLTLAVCVVLAGGCRKNNNRQDNDLRDFGQVNLVANMASYDPKLVDATLRDAWGLAWAPSGIAWVNSTVQGVSELYMTTPSIVRPPVNIPSPTDSVGGAPIGIVFNSTKGFVLPNKATAAFIFDGGDGVVSAWNGGAGNNAFRIANNSKTASYTGLALANSGGANFLYAANFKSGKIEVWDTAWNPVTWMPFHDPGIPSGFHNFNIQLVGSWLAVTYAKVGANGRQAVGAGLGFVDIYTTAGVWVSRLASRGALNSPWGLTMAPHSFLEDHDLVKSDDSHGGSGNGNSNGSPGGPGDGNGNNNNNNDEPVMLVGNFGDGHINVFSLEAQFLGQLQSQSQKRVITIPGLWALGFAPTTATTISQNFLFFTAGPNQEADGVFGYLTKE